MAVRRPRGSRRSSTSAAPPTGRRVGLSLNSQLSKAAYWQNRNFTEQQQTEQASLQLQEELGGDLVQPSFGGPAWDGSPTPLADSTAPLPGDDSAPPQGLAPAPVPR